MADSSVLNIGFVILIGLPGSGKTTFAQFLKNCFENPNTVHGLEHISSYHVIHLCYDKLIPPSLHLDDGTWNDKRRHVLIIVEKLICHLKCLPFENVSKETDLSLIVDLSKLHKTAKRMLIIVDDNMYYRSMRYPYVQLARIYSLGVCQLHIHCELNEALKRNAGRNKENIVPEDVIKRMYNCLEPPNGNIHSWEHYSRSVSSEEPFSFRTFLNIYDILEEFITSPLSPIQNNAEEKASSRSFCSANVVHQSDLALRKILGNEIKSKKPTLNYEQVKALSKLLNSKKQLILENIKVGKMILPESVCSAVEECDTRAHSLLYDFLLNHLWIESQ